jgi:hypothetical protein
MKTFSLLAALVLAVSPAFARGGHGGFVRGGAARGGVVHGGAARGGTSRGGFVHGGAARGPAVRSFGTISSSRAAAPRATFGSAARGWGPSASRSASGFGPRSSSGFASRSSFGFGSRLALSRRATDDAPPPNYSKPGALIRTEGQLPVYSDPGNARTFSVEGGGFIAQEAAKSRDAARAPGVAWGAPDTPPSVNPTSGAGAGGGGVTANGPAITVNNDHSGNVNGNQYAGGPAPSGTGFDPSF